MNNESKIVDYTVAELIRTLKQFPQDLPVVVSGYESGFENLLEPKKVKLEYNPENKYWDCEFQVAEQKSKKVFDAVVLRRTLRDVG